MAEAHACHATVSEAEWQQGYLDPVKLRGLEATFATLGYATIGEPASDCERAGPPCSGI